MITRLILSSKAGTLRDLSDVLESAKILPMYTFYVRDYKEDKENILKNCLTIFDTDIIVRSSSYKEDTIDTSSAGMFDSILNVGLDRNSIFTAIEKVILSYGTSFDNNDEVFIQPMLKNVTMSGVVFTSDLDTLAPYYIINYDLSGSTQNVTGGVSNNLETFITYKKYDNIENEKLELVLKSAKECEEIFDNTFLDIEFAYSDDTLYILQVRQIVKNNKINLNEIHIENSLNKLSSKISKLNTNHPKLLGEKTIFGIMPDWNPAEIIGVRPKRLALSLYKELITDEIWAYQRDNYGYRNLRSFPILVSFLGIPYIDVRVSFNSFIPSSLNEIIASKLVNYYLSELSQNTHFHDKIEFDIIYSCYFFGINKKLKNLKIKGFNENEIKRIEFSLLELTNNIIDKDNGLYKKDILKIEKLQVSYSEIVNSSLSLMDKIYWLIEDCKRFGTLPFAGVARAAFIAVQFLNSLVDEDVISAKESNSFLNSLNTVSKQLNKDKNILDKKTFLEIYGHLRPGTYDITSKRYDEDYDHYFSDENTIVGEDNFIFSDKKKSQIKLLLDENGLNFTVEEFLVFLKEAIEGREYLKFIFTKHLSKILQYIEELGKKFSISRDDLSYLDIQKILNLYSTLDYRDVKDIFECDIEKNKQLFKYTKAVKLPSIILKESDIYHFHLKKDEPNFITQKQIQGNVISLNNILSANLKDKVVCIKSADPGYDYLFTKEIVGLITCYGGANSHMAVRCAELGIPAIIGCGETKFSIYSKAIRINIDALNKKVRVIK